MADLEDEELRRACRGYGVAGACRALEERLATKSEPKPAPLPPIPPLDISKASKSELVQFVATLTGKTASENENIKFTRERDGRPADPCTFQVGDAALFAEVKRTKTDELSLRTAGWSGSLSFSGSEKHRDAAFDALTRLHELCSLGREPD